VLLAHLPHAILLSYYPEHLRRITSSTLPDLPALEHELQQVRERGYALNVGEHLTEVCAIGVSINGRHGRPIAAVTVAGPSTRWNRRRLKALAPRLATAADEISRGLREHAP
jgi:IclR family acetate operon transcriptional repressor